MTELRKDGKLCETCASPLPMRRLRFCKDACRQFAADVRRARRVPCVNCGGDKGYGTRGGKYCPDCRVSLGPVWAQMERERAQVKGERQRRAAGVPKRRPKFDGEGRMFCVGCDAYISPSKFRKNFTPGNPPARCVPCSRQYHHEYGLKTKYGIDSVEYHRMFDMQGGRCAICRNRPVRSRLAVDHNHRTGEVRGLLCKRCNHDLLGAAHDSIELLERAVSYLESPPAVTGVPVLIHEDYQFKKGNKS